MFNEYIEKLQQTNATNAEWTKIAIKGHEGRSKHIDRTKEKTVTSNCWVGPHYLFQFQFCFPIQAWLSCYVTYNKPFVKDFSTAKNTFLDQILTSKLQTQLQMDTCSMWQLMQHDIISNNYSKRSKITNSKVSLSNDSTRSKWTTHKTSLTPCTYSMSKPLLKKCKYIKGSMCIKVQKGPDSWILDVKGACPWLNKGHKSKKFNNKAILDN